MSVLATSLILLAMLLVVQFSLAYYARQVLAGAAQDGAAAGARRDASPADATAVAAGLVDQAGTTLVESPVVEVEAVDDRMVVTITGDAVSLLPFRRSIEVSATASVPVEQFRPQETGS
jgi:Flp pilus assembly protein TadG